MKPNPVRNHMNSTQAHNDYLDPDRHTPESPSDEQCEAMNRCAANLAAIVSDNGTDTVASLYRSIYKYTDCGPWLSVRLHDGLWKHCGDLNGVKVEDVAALLVGSIVEDSDAEVTGTVIELASFEKPEDAVAAFAKEVEGVNEEACALWDEAHEDGTP